MESTIHWDYRHDQSHVYGTRIGRDGDFSTPLLLVGILEIGPNCPRSVVWLLSNPGPKRHQHHHHQQQQQYCHHQQSQRDTNGPGNLIALSGFSRYVWQLEQPTTAPKTVPPQTLHSICRGLAPTGRDGPTTRRPRPCVVRPQLARWEPSCRLAHAAKNNNNNKDTNDTRPLLERIGVELNLEEDLDDPLAQ